MKLVNKMFNEPLLTPATMECEKMYDYLYGMLQYDRVRSDFFVFYERFDITTFKISLSNFNFKSRKLHCRYNVFKMVYTRIKV